ncbi:unnamed protein product [Clonostachys rhizophaga]|uniref:Uncharacterized protein n=1 Tax=Clonostachys rhizophaga TaxID=160324 RepID=A0A9N9VCK0_9HYPO|nr:unnamed protein product [Clonostachys rhizophaga]
MSRFYSAHGRPALGDFPGELAKPDQTKPNQVNGNTVARRVLEMLFTRVDPPPSRSRRWAVEVALRCLIVGQSKGTQPDPTQKMYAALLPISDMVGPRSAIATFYVAFVVE